MTTSKQDYSVLKDVRESLGRIQFTFKGDVLGPDDTQLMRTSLGYWYALLQDLLPIDRSLYYRRWINSMCEIDVYYFGKFLTSVDTLIKGYLSRFENDGVRWDLQSFKRSVVGRTYWGCISPIYPVLTEYLIQPDGPGFRILNQWINFIRRLNLRGLDLSSEMEADYVAFEEHLHAFQPAGDILEALNRIMRSWVSGFQPDVEFIPKHGPGSIAGQKGRLPLVRKYTLMKADQRLRYLSSKIGDIDSYVPLPLEDGLERVSEIVCVPKSMITNRTISKEPVALQYFQQGVLAWIVEMTKQHPVLSRHIAFEHQEYSADLARVGSLFGDYATIDLSAASDSVSYHIVKRVFAGTWLLPFLVCTRSDSTRLPSGKVLPLAKFAPMGSAVCFPIETLIFAACCELATEDCGEHSYFRVFGDDIVISQCAVSNLLEILDGIGFKVNSEKSFWGTELLNFREACGGEYFNGYEVTPARISRGFKGSQKLTIHHADDIQQYISFANKAFDYGYLQLRREILYDLKSSLPTNVFHKLIYSFNGRYGIKSFADCVTNYRLSSRHNANFCKAEIKGIIPKSIVAERGCERCRGKVPLGAGTCDNVRYFEWLKQSVNRDVPTDEVLRICPAVSVMRSAWIPTEYL